jgi:hypothetical protein
MTQPTPELTEEHKEIHKGAMMPPCECNPSNCYWDCFHRHICRWQREQIDYWCNLDGRCDAGDRL